MAAPLLLATYLSTINLLTETKIMVWVICILICIYGVYKTSIDLRKERKEDKAKEYYYQSIEKAELFGRGFPEKYVDGLGKNPLLKHSFNNGEKYEQEGKYNKAIKEYMECLLHPKASDYNKVAANILIGNCYYHLSLINEAEKFYKDAFKISKRLKKKGEK